VTTAAAAHNLDEVIHDDHVFTLDLGIHEARDLVQNRPLWRLMSLHSTMPRSGACCYWIGLDSETKTLKLGFGILDTKN